MYTQTTLLELPASEAITEAAPEGPRRAVYVCVKLVIEWFVALLMALPAAPLLLVLAVLVKIASPGPAFYVQTRLGRSGRTFRIIKLRTMVHDCELRSGPVWSVPGDTRVTPLGRILRSTHLDELPQLINVLRGEMALVGPRPERPEIAARIERALPEYRNRLLLRPGVTGLAQMRLPPDSDLEGVRIKLAHDLYYVREVSPALDLRIVCSTACYFLAAVAHAGHDALVRSYGQAVEHALVLTPRVDRDGCELNLAESA